MPAQEVAAAVHAITGTHHSKQQLWKIASRQSRGKKKKKEKARKKEKNKERKKEIEEKRKKKQREIQLT